MFFLRGSVIIVSVESKRISRRQDHLLYLALSLRASIVYNQQKCISKEKGKLALALDEGKKNGQDEYLHGVLSPDVLRQLLVVCPTPKE